MVKPVRKVDYILLYVISCCLLCACNSQKKELQEKVEKMQSTTINIPYDRMVRWTSDSIKAISPWNKAKLKLVHYVDSAACSTCYLHKVASYELLFQMEKLSNNEFYNIFIVNPDKKARKIIELDFIDKKTPQTIFVDSTDVFKEANPNIPSESMYHTFLLDENNKVILVGNPMSNQQVKDMMLSVVEKKLGRKLNISKLREKNE